MSDVAEDCQLQPLDFLSFMFRGADRSVRFLWVSPPIVPTSNSSVHKRTPHGRYSTAGILRALFSRFLFFCCFTSGLTMLKTAPEYIQCQFGYPPSCNSEQRVRRLMTILENLLIDLSCQMSHTNRSQSALERSLRQRHFGKSPITLF